MIATTFQKNQIVLGDAKTLSLSLSDNSVDCVCTDPPYLKKDVEGGIYSWLAEVSARVLKPGGFCIAYCGTYWLAQVLAQMTPHLTFFWEYRILFRDGYTAGIHYQRRTKPGSTPLLVFQKKADHLVLPYRTVLDVYKGAGADKQFHKWGQDAYSIQFYLDCFSRPGHLVWDPKDLVTRVLAALS